MKNLRELKELEKHAFFTLKELSNPKESQVYIKGDYDRKSKTFSCVKFSDVNCERFFPADKLVYVGFTF